jgi:predicted MFS family arabinose efflux permease
MGLIVKRLAEARREYPGQFWLMFWGMLISTIGTSMIWPFLMVYLTKVHGYPLTKAALLLSINAFTGLIFSFIAGPITDFTGRKRVMVFSLIALGGYYLLLSQAKEYGQFQLLMVLGGALMPLYRVGADAMLADLVPAEKRADGYSLIRMANNLGIAVGPMIGGFVAAASFTYSFVGAAIGLSSYGFLMWILARETLSRDSNEPEHRRDNRFAGYPRIFRDRQFLSFILGTVGITIAVQMMWSMLAVYTTRNYQLQESQYGWLPATNAVMVVTLQFLVTQVTKKRPPLLIMAAGAAVYTLGVFSVSQGSQFWHFWLAMVVFTLGELILVPTASTYAANLAPADMRGRYMSLYGLTWNVAQMIGAPFGGLLSDNLGPKYIWYGSAVIGALAVLYFLFLAGRQRRVALSQAQDVA